jgi:hypothetical protein
MKSLTDVVSGAGLAGYAEIALLIFFLVFVAVGLRTLLSSKTTFADVARMPLDDEPTLRSNSPEPSHAGAPKGAA